MQTCVKRALQIAVATGGLLFLGAGLASADTGVSVDLDVNSDISVGGAQQNSLDLLDLPINVSRVEIDALTAGAEPATRDSASSESVAPIDLPLNVSDVDVNILSNRTDGSMDSESAESEELVDVPVNVSNIDVDVLNDADEPASVDSEPASDDTDSESTVNVPITVTDIDVDVLDGGSGDQGGSPAVGPNPNPATVPDSDAASGPDHPLVALPVTVCGVAGGLVGEASASCTAPSADSNSLVELPILICGIGLGSAQANCSDPVSDAPSNAAATDAATTIANVPVTVCGIGIGVLGDSSAQCTNTPVNPGGGGIDVPVTVCGVALGLLGDASANCSGSDPADPGNTGTPETPGNPGTPSNPGAAIPVDVSTTPGTSAVPALRGISSADVTVTSVASRNGQANGIATGTRVGEPMPAGSLAFTGFDVNDAVPFGIALLVLGGLMLLRRRPRQVGP